MGIVFDDVVLEEEVHNDNYLTSGATHIYNTIPFNNNFCSTSVDTYCVSGSICYGLGNINWPTVTHTEYVPPKSPKDGLTLNWPRLYPTSSQLNTKLLHSCIFTLFCIMTLGGYLVL